MPKELGRPNDYNIDMVPKFMMGNGQLVKILIHTDVTKYLEFKAVDGSYVCKDAQIHKVPATDMEALKSPLMGFFEKRRARKFFIYVQNYNEADARTFEGRDLTRMTMAQLFMDFGLDQNTVDFIGHALALHRDDRYLQEPALPTVRKIKLYEESLARFEGVRSPYIYPLYGLGELPQAFARLSAVYGGTYMLAKPKCTVVYNENGQACGVTSDGETATCDLVVGDPSYFPGKSKVVSRVVRAACILSHPIPGTDNSHSVQVIIPQRQTGRRSDIYVFSCSYAHKVAGNGKWLAFVSNTVETDNPENELAPGLAILGGWDYKFVDIAEVSQPLEDGRADRCFITSGYDATTHFETTVADVLDLYQRITGRAVDFTKGVTQH